MSVAAPSSVILKQPYRLLGNPISYFIAGFGNVSANTVTLRASIHWTDALTAAHFTKVKVEKVRLLGRDAFNAGSWGAASTTIDVTVAGINSYTGNLLNLTPTECRDLESFSRLNWNTNLKGQFPSVHLYGVRITLTNVLTTGEESSPTVFTVGFNPMKPVSGPSEGPLLALQQRLELDGDDLALPTPDGDYDGVISGGGHPNSTTGTIHTGVGLSPVNGSDSVAYDEITAAGERQIALIPIDEFTDVTALPGVSEGTILRATVSRRSYSAIEHYTQFLGGYVVPPSLYSFLRINDSITGGRFTPVLTFPAPPPVVPFQITVPASASGKTGEELRVRLENNYACTWSITNNPGWLRIEDTKGGPIMFDGIAFGTFLVGTPPAAGTYTINLSAQRPGDANPLTRTCTITVITPVRTLISTNASISRDGTIGQVGDSVNIALQSTPSPAVWTAVGLPPGLAIDANGLISGTYRRSGSYLASITAIATPQDRHLQSLPFTIKFVITGQDDEEDNTPAILRVPWLIDQYELTDVQVFARSKRVESTLFDGGALRLKIGDTLSLAVFFIDAANTIFDPEPEQVRFTVRKADNLDDFVFEHVLAAGTAIVEQETPYYLLDVSTGDTERETVLEWAEENEANEPLLCAADIEWTKDGKVYSSRTFGVRLELDVSRP